MHRWMNEMPALLRQFAARWKTYLALHLAVALLIFLVLAPLGSLLLRLAVMLSGDTALSDQDIAWFILSPAGFVVFVVLVSVFSIIVFLEHAAMVTAAWLLERGHPAPVSGVLFFLGRRFGSLFGLAVQILFRVLLWTVPFLLAVGAVYFVLLTEFDINYYLSNKPSEWNLALALGGVIGAAWLAMLLRLFTSWVFSIPLLLLGGRTPRVALEQSAQAADGKRRDILRAFFAWLLLMAVLSLAASALTGLAGFLLVRPDVQSIESLVLGLGVVSALGAIASVAVSLIGSALMSLLILRLFQAHVAGADELAGIPDDDVRPAGRVAARRIAVLAVVALAVVAAGAAYALVNQLQLEGETAVMAHRGASAAAPENTLAAIRGAIESGADWVEIDVQETADGEIVVVHDSDLKKIGGSSLVVGRSTLAELQTVDIGSWFDPRFSDQRLPTLREVLTLCRDRIGVNIELKYYGTERRLEEGVAEIVDELGMADQVIAMSLSLPGIRRMAEVRPGWKTGLLSSVAVGNLAGLDVDFLALNGRAANRRTVRQLHDQGKEVFVWTVNDPVSVAVMASRGVDGIITDEPAMA
ncbi:MAG: glycerophosphodiester phosphodiesterase family protein, partial [Xanthomonadales bacterium]